MTVICCTLGASSQTITGYEYWFDTDYANKVFVSVSGGVVSEVNASIAASTLSQGYHTFWYHTKSSDGKWSVPVSSTFVNGNNSIVGLEYWYDNDYSTKVYTALTPSQGGEYDMGLPVSGLTIGNHTVSICFVDQFQVRSVPVSEMFYFDGSVGLETMTQPELYLFPNPATNELTLSGAGEFSWFEVYDSAGKMISSNLITSTNQKLDISHYSNGLYTVVLFNQSKPKTTKLRFTKGS